MRFPRLPWFRRQGQEPAHAVPIQPTEDMARPVPMPPTVDLTLSRRVFYRKVGTSSTLSCPRCNHTLVCETGVYFVTTRQGQQPGGHLIMSGNFGFYCPACPTVVMDQGELDQYVHLGAQNGETKPAYAVLGLVDLESLPEAQSHLSFDELDELPLIPFHAVDRPRRSQKKRRRNPKARRKQRR